MSGNSLGVVSNSVVVGVSRFRLAAKVTGNICTLFFRFVEQNRTEGNSLGVVSNAVVVGVSGFVYVTEVTARGYKQE